MEHVGPTQIKKKKKNKNRRMGETADGNFILNFFIFFSHFSIRFMEIEPSEFVEVRSNGLYSMRATRRNQKHRISPSF